MAYLGSSWAYLGHLLGRFEPVLPHLGPVLPHLGTILALLGPVLAHLGPVLAPLGGFLAIFGAQNGTHIFVDILRGCILIPLLSRLKNDFCGFRVSIWGSDFRAFLHAATP